MCAGGGSVSTEVRAARPTAWRYRRWLCDPRRRSQVLWTDARGRLWLYSIPIEHSCVATFEYALGCDYAVRAGSNAPCLLYL
jgi:hypothetical protein